MITRFNLYENIIHDISEDFNFINQINTGYWKYNEHTRKSLNILTPEEFYEKYGEKVIDAYEFLINNTGDINQYVIKWVKEIIGFLEEIPKIKILKNTKKYKI